MNLDGVLLCLKKTIKIGIYIMIDYDIIVIGGGHAGIEASLASARMGKKPSF